MTDQFTGMVFIDFRRLIVTMRGGRVSANIMTFTIWMEWHEI